MAFPKRQITILSILTLATLGTLLLAPLVGMSFIPPRALWMPHAEALNHGILLNIRIPRTCMAFMAGAALSLSGMAFQSIFRNPLATPFTLGVSSGAALGSAVYIRFGLSLSLLGISGLSLAAFAGALIAMTSVYGITRLKGGFSSATLLLAGVAISYFCSSLILVIQYLSGFTHSFKIIRWMMGSLDVTGYEPVRNLFVLVVVGSVAIMLMIRELNLLMTGEELALSRGANVALVKKLLFTAVSLMIGGVVAFCGPIGFVGLMVPHICRLLIGPDHRYLAPATFLFGGLFLTLCDTLARTVIAPTEIPVGIITALLGGPFFIWLLLTRKGILEMS